MFLFEATRLLATLKARGVKIGVATSVRVADWEAARVYPEAAAGIPLQLASSQVELLRLFGE